MTLEAGRPPAFLSGSEFEVAPGFADLGITAFTTTRAAGSFSLGSDEPVGVVYGRWWTLFERLSSLTPRLASAQQVHGTEVTVHAGEWRGWLRARGVDGHIAVARPTAMAVTIADCVPVFIAHPSGAAAVLHAGWRGTAARILDVALAHLANLGLRASDLRIHCGPGICGRCYVVGPDVYAALTGATVTSPTAVDLRGVIGDQARRHGVGQVTSSSACTRCDNDRFFSHRAGDSGRQIAVIVSA